MPEVRKTYTLLQVATSIRNTLHSNSTGSYWITAEMIRLNYYARSGIAYPDLVQKDHTGIVAQMRAIIWRNDFDAIAKKFKDTTGSSLEDGSKILFLASVRFDPVHGLALHISDIDPTFTLGELEMERRKTLERLSAEGLLVRNKQLPFPLLPKRIAVISVASSKGFKDFVGVLENATDQFGFAFSIRLFPVILQGNQAVKEIGQALDQINKVASDFDVVAIVRGGGADLTLAAFDSYELAKQVALCPLPVRTGIGHKQNLTAVDRVAWKDSIAPSDLAHELVTLFVDFKDNLEAFQLNLIRSGNRLLSDSTGHLKQEVQNLQWLSKRRLQFASSEKAILLNRMSHLSTLFLTDKQIGLRALEESLIRGLRTDVIRNRNLIEDKTKSIIRSAKQFFHRSSVDLKHAEQRVHDLSPEQTLKRGFSITLLKGRSVRDPLEVPEGEILESKLFRGSVFSKVLKGESQNLK